MPILTTLLEPFFRDPSRRDLYRRLIQSGMQKQKQMLTSVIPKNISSLLDIGCGTGEFCEVVPPTVYQGIDTDRDGIDYAKKFHPSYHFFHYNTLSELNRKYDVIMFVDTIHHISPTTLNLMFSEISKRLLAKNGRVILLDTVHPAEQKSLLGKWVVSNDRGRYSRKKHEICAEIKNYFKVVSYETFNENFFVFYLAVLKKAQIRKRNPSV